MSDYGSFITSEVWCSRCFEMVKAILLEDHKHLRGIQLVSQPSGKALPIIAGRLASLGIGGEALFMAELMSDIARKVCHPVQAVVLCESGYIVAYSTEACFEPTYQMRSATDREKSDSHKLEGLRKWLSRNSGAFDQPTTIRQFLRMFPELEV